MHMCNCKLQRNVHYGSPRGDPYTVYTKFAAAIPLRDLLFKPADLMRRIALAWHPTGENQKDGGWKVRH